MSDKNKKSLNGLVFLIASKRLNLKRKEKIIFQRLLGFLIRNNKPFPFSRKSLSELTGYSCSSIDEALNKLECLRLITRVGYTNRVKFIPGSILLKIFTLAQNRINYMLYNNYTLPQKLGKLPSTTPVSGYKKTSLSLKHKEKDFFTQEIKDTYQEYCGRIKSDEVLGLIPKGTKPKEFEKWIEEKE